MPYINASIVLQLLTTAFPSLKKLQREEGPQVPTVLLQTLSVTAVIFCMCPYQAWLLMPCSHWLGVDMRAVRGFAVILSFSVRSSKSLPGPNAGLGAKFSPLPLCAQLRELLWI